MTIAKKPLSAGEKRMAGYVDEYPNAPGEETPEERAARVARNWDEIKKARIQYLKERHGKGVTALDAELEAGRGTDFPSDASFDEDADLGPLAAGDDDLGPLKRVPPVDPNKGKPRTQGAVRASEPPLHLIEQEAAERGWDNAQRAFTAGGGVLKPGQTQAQAVTEKTGLRDPAETRGVAEARHAAETGELQYGDSVAYNATKPLASIAGFAAKGPLGATAAEALVRATALGYNLNAALDNGMDPDKAVQIFVKEISSGAAADGAFNFGAPLVGMVIAKIPGLNRIADKIHAALQARIGGPAPKMSVRDKRIGELKDMTDNPARKQAVDELTKRVEDDYIPTPGQVRGDVGVAESAITHAFPKPFERQETALTAAAEKMRRELVDAGSQPAPQQLGQQLDRVAEETVKRTKARLRPVFEEADRLNVVVDFNDVATIARNALAKDAQGVGKGKLTEAERNHLQGIIDGVNFQPWRGAEPALDFSSVQKSIMRKINPDGKPTPYFTTIVGDMTRASEEAFEEAARRMGQSHVYSKLRAARDDYRVMNEAAYKGAMKQVLTKGEHAPEDIGRYLWSEGKVTRIDELDELLSLARREGVASPKALEKLRRNVTRGFMQEAVQDVKAAATWSESLKDPSRRATWEALTRGPEGQALKDGMAVLEQAAQMTTMRNVKNDIPFFKVGIGRAASGGLGISWVTGAFSPWLAGAGLSIAGTMKLMSTAYVHGDKGAINLVSKVLRANSTATAASAKALQALVPELEKVAQKYDVTDLFMKKDEDLGPEQPAGGGS